MKRTVGCCVSGRCTRVANRQGLCQQHYNLAPVRGDVDGTATRERIQLLLDRGVGWKGIKAATGLSAWWLTSSTGKVRARTEQLILGIPVPDEPVAGGRVSGLGTARRIQALACIGWPQAALGPMLGRGPAYTNQMMHRGVLMSSTAADFARLYRELCVTPGPSEAAKRIAAARGWAPPLAWDDIDDPDETPKHEVTADVSFEDRYRELRDCGYSREEIAVRWGIKVDSLERQLYRLKVAA